MKVKNQYLKMLECLHLSFNKWPSIQYKLWVSLVFLNNNGERADLAMVQKIIIDTLHKEGKSQRVITERVAVQGVLYQSILNAKLTGRINWVGKCVQATGMTTSLIILSSKANSNTWESFTRSELKLESVHQESPCSDIFRKRNTSETETSSEASYLG